MKKLHLLLLIAIITICMTACQSPAPSFDIPEGTYGYSIDFTADPAEQIVLQEVGFVKSAEENIIFFTLDGSDPAFWDIQDSEHANWADVATFTGSIPHLPGMTQFTSVGFLWLVSGMTDLTPTTIKAMEFSVTTGQASAIATATYTIDPTIWNGDYAVVGNPFIDGDPSTTLDDIPLDAGLFGLMGLLSTGGFTSIAGDLSITGLFMPPSHDPEANPLGLLYGCTSPGAPGCLTSITGDLIINGNASIEVAEINAMLDVVTVDGNVIHCSNADDEICDTDEDGYTDDIDNCPEIANPGQEDTDLDGVGDDCDNCPADPNNDVDEDGICGDVDSCPADPDNDIDEDGICGDIDNCPEVANPGQEDTDLDGVGDDCDSCPADPDNDVDEDGICGNIDNCPDDANPGQEDTDLDGVADACDNCPAVANSGQEDTDADGIGDSCPPLQTINLCEKSADCIANPAEWACDPDAETVTVTYTPAGPTLDVQVTGTVPFALTNYTLVYYPDPWPGTGMICLGSALSGSDQTIAITASNALAQDLPLSGDLNSPNAKLWLLPSNTITGCGGNIIGWPCSSIMFEATAATDFMTYTYIAP